MIHRRQIAGSRRRKRESERTSPEYYRRKDHGSVGSSMPLDVSWWVERSWHRQIVICCKIVTSPLAFTPLPSSSSPSLSPFPSPSPSPGYWSCHIGWPRETSSHHKRPRQHHSSTQCSSRGFQEVCGGQSVRARAHTQVIPQSHRLFVILCVCWRF